LVTTVPKVAGFPADLFCGSGSDVRSVACSPPRRGRRNSLPAVSGEMGAFDAGSCGCYRLDVAAGGRQ